MDRIIRTFSLFSLTLLAVSASSFAQSSASADADIETKIVAGITLSKTQDLQFGSVVRSPKGGTVTINPNTDQISYSGVTRGQNMTYRAAAFESTGEPDYSYSISLPKKATLTRKGGKQTMTVTDFTHSDKAGHMDGKGSDDFKVGATLEVGSNQETGSYSGEFTVMVEYH